MKLLEDVSSAVTHQPPPRRTRLTLGVTAAFLLVAAVLGVLLIVSSDGGGAEPGDPVADPPPSGTLADWAAGVTDACTTVAAEQPVMAQGPDVRLDPANRAAVEAGTSALVAAVHQVPLPADEAEQAQASAVVAVGDQAEDAWTALAGSSGDVAAEQLVQAAELTAGFVAGVTQLGADCAPIG